MRKLGSNHVMAPGCVQDHQSLLELTKASKSKGLHPHTSTATASSVPAIDSQQAALEHQEAPQASCETGIHKDAACEVTHAVAGSKM